MLFRALLIALISSNAFAGMVDRTDPCPPVAKTAAASGGSPESAKSAPADPKAVAIASNRNYLKWIEGQAKIRSVTSEIATFRQYVPKSDWPAIGTNESQLADLQKKGEQSAAGRGREEAIRRRSYGVGPESCGSVDLRAKFGPVRNQDSTNWCAAFAASDLLSFKTGRTVSAAYLRAEGNRNSMAGLLGLFGVRESEDATGRFIGHMLETGLDRGLCAESTLPSETMGNDPVYLCELRRVEKLVSELRGTGKPSTAGCENLLSAERLIPGGDPRVWAEALMKAMPGNVLRSFSKEACRGKLFRPAGKLQAKGVSSLTKSKGEILSEIDRQLSRQNPTAFLTHSSSFYDPMAEAGMMDLHYALLIGRRWNAKARQCEYLVRNSWGRACDVVHSSYGCEKDGYFWIPRQHIGPYILGASYVE